ncbi:cellulose synthase subunit BcsC-related outer membrane protein [Thiolapillus sp.]
MYGRFKTALILAAVLLASVAGSGFAAGNPADTLLQQAEFWRSLGRNDLALQALQKGLRVTPDDPAGLALMAFTKLDLGQREEAEELFRQLKKRHPQSEQTAALEQVLEITGLKRKVLREARLLARAGRQGEALQLFRELFQPSPLPSPLALEYWNLLGQQPASWEAARQGLQTLIRAYPGNLRYRMAWARHLARVDPPPQESIDTFIELTRYSQLRREAMSGWRNAVLGLDRVPASLPALRAYLQQDPGDSRVAERIKTIETKPDSSPSREEPPLPETLRKGIALLDDGDLAAAEPLLKTSVAKWPRQARAAGAMGHLRLKQARYREAVSWLQKTIALEPEHAGKWRSLLQTAEYWGLIQRGKAALANKDLQQAQTLLSKAVKSDPQGAYGITLLAETRLRQGDVHDAERLYRKALAIDPLSNSAMRGLVNLYADNEGLDEAFSFLDDLNASQRQELGDAYPVLRAALLRKRADRQSADGNGKAAMDTLQQAVTLDPRNPWLRFDLAHLLLDAGQDQQGMALFEEGIALAPQDPQMRYAYALLLSRLDRDAEALQQMQVLPADELSANMRQYRKRLQGNLQLQQVKRLAERLEQQGAAEVLRQMQEQFRADPDMLLRIAAVWQDIDRPGESLRLLRDLEEGKDLDTKQRQRRRELEIAAVLDQAGKRVADGEIEAALELLMQARERLGAEPKLVRRMAQLQGRAGNYDAALSSYRTLVAKDMALPKSQSEDRQWLRWAHTTSDSKLRDEVGELLQRESPAVLSGLHLGFRDATEGLSSLASREVPLEGQWPLYGGRLFAHVAPIRLDAGKLDLSNPRTRSLYGTGALCLEDCVTTPLSQVERGTGLALGYLGNGWRADLGASPLRFSVSNLLGGVEIDGDLGELGWTLGLSQRPVTSTMLSYSGMKDAETGKIWGGVVATGLHLGLSWDQGGPYGIWGSLGAHDLHGKNVPDNLRLRALGGIYWRLHDEEDSQLRGGLNLMTWRFDKNLEEFTFGHGGYYSPQAYVSVSLPVSYYGRKDRWSWEVRGSVSYSYSRIDDSPFFPNDPALQAEAERLEGVTGITPYYEGDSGGGSGYSFSGAVEYRVNPYLHLGASMSIERSDFYTPNHFAVYFKYSARPHLDRMPLFPHPTTLYSDFD